MAIYKNKAGQKLAVFAVDSAGAAKTGDAANITAYLSKDGGAAAATNDANPTELDATNAKGVYLFDLTQAETNADLLVLAPKSATSGVTLRPVIVYTEPEMRSADVTNWKGATAPAMTGDAYARLGAPSGESIAADIATRSTLTAADVWSHATRTLTSFGTLVADIWAALTSGLTTVGSIGKLLVDRIDETISSRSTYAGGDTSGTTELLTRLTSGRASNLDNLDAQVSSRLAGASYTAPLDASGTRSALGLASANLDTQLSGLPGAIADAVWDEVTSGHATPGTTGKALTDAGAAGVPPTAEEVAEAVVAEAAFKKILAMASGKVTKSGDAYTFYAEDNTTPLFTLTYTDTNRTVS